MIYRDKSGLNHFYPKFLMNANSDNKLLENNFRFLLMANKKPFNKTSNYGIFMS